MSSFIDKRKSRARTQVLGAKAFAAISAAEGLRLGTTSQKRLDELKGAGLSQDEKRAVILGAYKATSDRK